MKRSSVAIILLGYGRLNLPTTRGACATIVLLDFTSAQKEQNAFFAQLDRFRLQAERLLNLHPDFDMSAGGFL